MEEKDKQRVSIKDKMVLIGIGFAAVYWLMETFMFIFSYELNFFQSFFGPRFSGIATRLIVLLLFVIFGAHAQYTINERKFVEEELSKLKTANDELQQQIASLKETDTSS
jgi:hypothetical protein